MAPKAREPPLSLGDTVSVAVRHFGEDYARERAGSRRWTSEDVRDEGVVQEKASSGKYKVKFSDDGEVHWFSRKLLRLVQRAEAAARAPLQEDSSGGETEDAEAWLIQEDIDDHAVGRPLKQGSYKLPMSKDDGAEDAEDPKGVPETRAKRRRRCTNAEEASANADEQ